MRSHAIFLGKESKESELIFEDEKVTVRTVPLIHRVYTNGFLFQEKESPRTLNIEAARKYGIDKSQFNNIKKGKDGIDESGNLVSNRKLTLDPPEPKSYAFCSDTVYNETIVPIIKDVCVLYHESTFLESEEHLCEKTKHSTAKQAAQIAKKANAELLILGHYSTRYKSIELFKKEAEEVFPLVELADDGKSFEF